ncbi:MAG: RusA family crossover junction endodeoxyribonuclease [Acidobacteriota bacterium]|nr:RusA family crossover junction endodeoxyribonuclease [Acidobacteriota bacterium]
MPNSESDFTLQDGVLRFNDEAKSLRATVEGRIINSATKNREWKEQVACTVKAQRGDQWCSKHLYAVTLQFRFRQLRTPRDVDNYVKPVLDGLAAGLFLEEDKFLPDGHIDIPTFAVHYGVDDSNFRTLLIRRLPDAANTLEQEEVHLFVSRAGAPPDTEATDQSGKAHPR